MAGPLDNIFGGGNAISFVAENLGPTLDLVREVTDYGTHLVSRCLNTSERTIVDVVAVGVFVKHVVSMLDAVEILGRQSATLAARVEARAQLEASLYAQWVLTGDSQHKARCFYVWNLRHQRRWARRVIPGSEESDAFRELLGEMYRDPHRNRPELHDRASDMIAEIDQILANRFVDIEAEFEARQGDRDYDSPWHSLAGARSVRAIAEQLGRLHEYEAFYTSDSQAAHSSSYQDHFHVRDGQVVLEPIRNLRGLTSLLNTSVTTAFATYRFTLNYYRPDEIEAFNRHYRENWRDRYLGIPEIEVEILPSPRP